MITIGPTWHLVPYAKRIMCVYATAPLLTYINRFMMLIRVQLAGISKVAQRSLSPPHAPAFFCGILRNSQARWDISKV